MRLFVCTLLVTMVVVAMLVDETEGWWNDNSRRRSGKSYGKSSRMNSFRRSGLQRVEESELREAVEKAGSLLDILEEEAEQLDAREFLDDLEEEDYARKRR